MRMPFDAQLSAHNTTTLSISLPSTFSHIVLILTCTSFLACCTLCIGRGGQSALRFARLRLEKRHNYVRKVAETMVQCFITEDQVNVEGLILAGSADFKTELSQSDMFDQVRVLI